MDSGVSKPRQAGAIEITPEMIAAGEDVLWDLGSAEEIASADYGTIVRSVFSAMLSAGPTHRAEVG
ncbi:hypothetical protein FRZ44_26130 [Hypericibacter terrae]|uniref:Uncharacterized protein n=1 Tax=Hypericibacter terrae TaxID=2602015 RepID=A0A5J6MJ87_9PROT|nr:hypothetical protein FRZ44_26130 [Hypericibacter terrae]